MPCVEKVATMENTGVKWDINDEERITAYAKLKGKDTEEIVAKNKETVKETGGISGM